MCHRTRVRDRAEYQAPQVEGLEKGSHVNTKGPCPGWDRRLELHRRGIRQAMLGRALHAKDPWWRILGQVWVEHLGA
jgi:hypothetical protein